MLLVWIAIQTELFQNWITGIATKRLSAVLGTEVSIRNVSITLFNRLNMEGALIRDKKKDTLLYAGQLKVRITDWFFFQDTTVLKYVGLEDATVKFQRNGPEWNYQFVADYFSAPPTNKKKGGGMILDLKKLDLKNVRFLKNDSWGGEKIEANVGSVLLEADKFDLKKAAFVINDLSLDEPFVAISNIPELRPDSLKRFNTAVTDTGMYFNPGNLALKVSNIKIRNGSLFIEGNSRPATAGFDGSHIELSKLNGTLTGASFIKDTIRANINLSVKDRCGLELKKLKTTFKFTPQIMELASLDLQTNRSRLRDYYAMRFHDFNKDFADYVHKVIMNAWFREAKIDSDDIAYFASDLKTWKKTINLVGDFTGTVDNFIVNHMTVRSGGTSDISGTLAMKGLPDINTTRISFNNGALKTNYTDIATFIPSLKGITDPNMAALGTIIYRGNFDGTIHNFVTTGVFSTQLGGLKTNISLQLPRKGDPTYTGNMETSRFNIGKFLNDDKLGMVDFKGKITGSNFTIDKIKTTLDGKISSLEYNNYTYSNITTNGTFQKKYFSGEVKVDDPNLNFTSTVEIDLSKDQPRFNILGDLVNSNLKELHFLKDPIELTGLLDVNFTGTTIDNFLGTAKFLNANIKSGDTKLSFDSLNLTSGYIDTVKMLHLGSNDFDASITGKFSIVDLPASFQVFLNHYYPAYIRKPSFIPENQQFFVTINTNYIEPYLKLFDKKISGFNDASLTGSVDTRRNELRINTRIPYGRYAKYGVTGVDLKGSGNMDTLSLTGEINSIEAGDSMRFPNTRLAITTQNDHSVVSIKTKATNTLNDADLYADVYTLEDGIRIQFRPSSFVLNEKKWNIEKAGELVVKNHLVDAKNIKLTQGFQEITVATVPVAGDTTNNLIVNLKNVILGDITSLFMKDPRLEGVTDGKILLSDFSGRFKADATLKVEQFRLDDDSIGLVNIRAGYDLNTGKIPFSIQSPNEGYHFSAKGFYNLKDTLNNPLNTDIQLENSKIDILHKFLSTLLTDIKGQATGDLNISGNLKSLNLLGRIKLKHAGMKVNYTQVYYTIDSADIRFEEDGINFGELTVQDRYKNTGRLKGKLFEKGFKNMRFDFDMSTSKLLLIDTKAKDNQQFYGKAIGSANLSFKGPEYDARMSIVAASNDSSHIFIPNSIDRQSGNADFIVFKQYGTEMARESANSNFNLSVDLDLTTTNDAQIDVIIDELAGDVIKATGNGRLRIKAGTYDPLSIRGRYNIERGSYNFNFQSFIRKPFILLPEAGNYIEWTGDPFKADVHIDAQYTAERVSLNDLVGNNIFSGTVKGYRGDVYVIAQLREKLDKPKISFKLDFPQGSPIRTDNEFAQYITSIENNDNEILKQVSYLILFNAFAPVGTGNGNTFNSSVTSLGVNSLSQLLTKGVNKLFSNILYKITGDKSLSFDIGTTFYSSYSLDPGTGVTGNSTKFDRTRVNLKLAKGFFDNKVIVTFGSDFDFNNGGSSAIQNGNFQWLPDLNVELILSKDRKLRAIIFNKNSLDINAGIYGRRNRQGVSISYRKDFEKLFGTRQDDIQVKAPADTSGGPKGQ